VHEGQCLSYGELNGQANKIAHYLRDVSGLRPDGRVAILVRHPPSAIIAMIAILKAGGAYVPLDPDSPPAVTMQILDDAAPTAILLDSSSAASAAFFDGDMFVMDVMGETLETSDADPAPLSRGEHLAYVIYTSGTTGAPKGVAVEHRAIVNTIRWRNRYYDFGPNDVTLSIPRPSFDSSVEDIFCMLTAGGSLLLPLRDRITDRRYLVDLIARQQVSHFLITPALYKRLLGGLDMSLTASLRSITVAGEWFTPGLVQEHYRRLPHAKLHNEYGPAENAVCSTVHPLSPADTEVLIGRSIDNTETFVLNEHGTPAGPGETGELYLAGAGLARCYLGNPGLTAEKFPVWPSPAGESIRVYRSGDMVRVCEHGELQFVGRRDRQVKIRGRRVELDDIAQCLAKDQQVDDVFVLHYVAPSGAPYLIAFVVGSSPDPARLIGMARDLLPPFMVPSMIIPVGEIPVTRNGKVDEEALLAIYADLVGDDNKTPAFASVAEASLLSMWRRLFPQLKVSLDDDFFDLGGDSLMAMELVLIIEEIIGIRLDSADIYGAKTIRNLARLMHRQSSRAAEVP
jgi:amino acid adenylation domain-containing protein